MANLKVSSWPQDSIDRMVATGKWLLVGEELVAVKASSYTKLSAVVGSTVELSELHSHPLWAEVLEQKSKYSRITLNPLGTGYAVEVRDASYTESSIDELPDTFLTSYDMKILAKDDYKVAKGQKQVLVGVRQVQDLATKEISESRTGFWHYSQIVKA